MGASFGCCWCGKSPERRANQKEDNRALSLDLPRLRLSRTPVQKVVGAYPAKYLGLGDDAEENLRWRQRLGQPGPPFGGMGLFDPGKTVVRPGEENLEVEALPQLTAQAIKSTKLEEIRRCSQGLHSFYFWSFQPIFNVHARAVGAELLVRVRNGTDSAPFEDILSLMDPSAPSEVREVYVEWKATEIVDFVLGALREHTILQNLSFISCNLRPSDLDPEGQLCHRVEQKLGALAVEDRALLVKTVLLEITEDQQYPRDIVDHVETWQRLGFRFALDDILSERAAEALGKKTTNFNDTNSLSKLVWHCWLVKVDMAWAGHILFLSHPSVCTRPEMRAEILQRARDDDQVYMAVGPQLRSLGIRHTEALREFALWAKEMINICKGICIELSVSPDDENCSLALERLNDLGLDIFGNDRCHFFFQGGPCGAKAFAPKEFAEAAAVLEDDTGMEELPLEG